MDADFTYAYNNQKIISCITNRNIVTNIDFIGVI